MLVAVFGFGFIIIPENEEEYQETFGDIKTSNDKSVGIIADI